MNTQNTQPKAEERAAGYTLDDIGCYVDSARGIYAIDRICQIAENHGWNRPEDSPEEMSDYEWSNEIEDEIDDYMNKSFSVEGAYWGRNENSDWGLWPIEQD